jgi:putative DNA primase/helicase
MGAHDVVLDVDPRKAGAEDALIRLLEYWPGLMTAPLVWTGGSDGGRHYYLRLPEPMPVHNPKEFEPLDFRHVGQFVVCAGAIHPDTGNRYEWDMMTNPKSSSALIPAPLLGLLEVKGAVPGASPRDKKAERSLDELHFLLEQLDPSTCRDYEVWLSVGMATHAATEGSPEGLKIWQDWSAEDPEYSDTAEEQCEKRWGSFGRRSGVTAASLAHLVRERGGQLFEAEITTAEEDFEEEEPAKKRPTVDVWIRETIDKLRPDANLEALVAESQRHYTLGDWERIRVALKRSVGASLKGLDKIYARCEKVARSRKAKSKEDADKDWGIEVAEKALEMVWGGGDNLIHAQNQTFYEYVGTHWAQVPDNVISRRILEAAEVLKMEGADIRPSQLFSSSRQVLAARCAQFEDVLKLARPLPPTVINTRNAEVWIPNDGSRPTVQKHDPKSYLISVLDTEYDPAAECPLFDDALLGIFRDNHEPVEMVRHFWEFVGYAIQPRKNLPTWWLLYGEGSNGKSLVTSVLGALLGSAILPREVSDFANTGRNNHALESLVGKLVVLDDDADVNVLLPESALKKLSESKLLEANPKNHPAFNFTSVATPVICVNGWPKTRDLSWGMLRKTYVVPFRRIFSEDESDVDLKMKIIDWEMSGVLNRALEGHARLRARKKFDVPKECRDAKVEWLRLANPLMDWVYTALENDPNEWVDLKELFSAYRAWCREQGGITHALSAGRFEASLGQLGYKFETDGRSKILRGVKIQPELGVSAEDDFK